MDKPEKNIKSKTKGHDSVLNLKEIKSKKSVTLYVRNIYRYCEDSVGCKIVVPERVSDTLTSENFWPEDIECRVWNRWTRNKENRYRPTTWNDADDAW